MELHPFNPAHHSRSELYTYHADGRRWLVKRYLEEQADERCQREEARIKHWELHGFSVPGLRASRQSYFDDPNLVMGFIDGITLGEWLESILASGECFLEQISAVLVEHAARHALATERSDSMLIHPDPNPFNILMAQGFFYSIDFESPLKDRALDELISLEVEQFILRLLRVVGAEHLEAVSDVLVRAYSGQEPILERIVRCHYKHPIVRYIKKGLGRKSWVGVTRSDLASALRIRLPSH